MIEEHTTESFLFLAPTLIGFDHRNVDLDQHPLMQVVHQGQKILGRIRQKIRILFNAEPRARQVQLLTVFQ